MLSIIIPIYNCEAYIEECLESVVCQTYAEPIECILVDDCGQDHSIEICKDYINRYNGTIDFKILRHEKNRGVSAARNTGIKASRGEYLAFIDSDDYCSPNLFETLQKASANLNTNVGIIGCNALKDEEGIISDFIWKYDSPILVSPEEYGEKHIIAQVPHAVWGKIYRKDIFAKTLFREGITNEDVMIHLDLMHYIEENNIYTYYIPEKLYYYRQRSESICSSSEKKFYLAELSTMETILKELPSSKKDLQDKILLKYISKLIYHASLASKKNSVERDSLSTLLSKIKSIHNADAFRVLGFKAKCVFSLLKYSPKLYQVIKS